MVHQRTDLRMRLNLKIHPCALSPADYQSCFGKSGILISVEPRWAGPVPCAGQDPEGSPRAGPAQAGGTTATVRAAGQMVALRALEELRSWTSYAADLSSNLETFSYPKKISLFKRLEAV